MHIIYIAIIFTVKYFSHKHIEYRPILFKNDIVVPKKTKKTNRFWYAYNSSYLCSKCWTWGGGGELKSI